jgi:hypothetical protein
MPGLSFKYPSSAFAAVGASEGGADAEPLLAAVVDRRNVAKGELSSTEVLSGDFRFEAGAGLPVPCRASIVRVRYAYCHNHPPAVSLLPLAQSG